MKFTIKKAEAQDAELFANVLQTVYGQMEHKEWFAIDEEPYCREMFASGKRLGYKALEIKTGVLSDVFAVCFPGDSKGNLGHDIGFLKKQCDLVAHMDTVAALPAYRGYYLQYQLVAHAERELYEMGCQYLMATVHPDNHASNSMLRLGYQTMTTKEKYGGFSRDILLKKNFRMKKMRCSAFD